MAWVGMLNLVIGLWTARREELLARGGNLCIYTAFSPSILPIRSCLHGKSPLLHLDSGASIYYFLQIGLPTTMNLYILDYDYIKRRKIALKPAYIIIREDK